MHTHTTIHITPHHIQGLEMLEASNGGQGAAGRRRRKAGGRTSSIRPRMAAPSRPLLLGLLLPQLLLLLLLLPLLPAPTAAFLAQPPLPSAPAASRSRRDGVVVMGIPKLFRWLVDLYPSVQQRVSETLGTETAKVSREDGERECL